MLTTAESWRGASEREGTRMSGVKDVFQNKRPTRPHVVVISQQLRLHPNVKHIIFWTFWMWRLCFGVSKKASWTSRFMQFEIKIFDDSVWMHQLTGTKCTKPLSKQFYKSSLKATVGYLTESCNVASFSDLMHSNLKKEINPWMETQLPSGTAHSSSSPLLLEQGGHTLNQRGCWEISVFFVCSFFVFLLFPVCITLFYWILKPYMCFWEEANFEGMLVL